MGDKELPSRHSLRTLFIISDACTTHWSKNLITKTRLTGGVTSVSPPPAPKDSTPPFPPPPNYLPPNFQVRPGQSRQLVFPRNEMKQQPLEAGMSESACLPLSWPGSCRLSTKLAHAAKNNIYGAQSGACLLYTSDAADD